MYHLRLQSDGNLDYASLGRGHSKDVAARQMISLPMLVPMLASMPFKRNLCFANFGQLRVLNVRVTIK